MLLFGAGWGVANVGFGIGLRLLGMALGMAIILGMNNALGAILPILLFHPNDLRQPAGMAIMCAVFVMLLGICFCALAGAKKDRVRQELPSGTHANRRQFSKGLMVCLLSGVLGAMFNFALIAGKPLEERAIDSGAMPSNASNATWCIALFGGFLATLVYCLYLKSKNRSWRLYALENSRANWLLTFLMGAMWFGGVVLFGMAVTKLGRLGPSIGWPLIQSMAVASGNFWGLVTGEWKDAGRTFPDVDGGRPTVADRGSRDRGLVEHALNMGIYRMSIQKSEANKASGEWWELDLLNKPDSDMAMRRIYAWYHQEMLNGRSIRFTAHNAEHAVPHVLAGRTWRGLKSRWLDAEYQVDFFSESIKGRSLLAEKVFHIARGRLFKAC